MPGIHASGGQNGDSSDPFGQNCQGCHLLWPSTWSMQGKETQALSKDELQMGATQLFPGLWTRLALPQELAACIPWLPKGLSRQNGSRCCCHATWPGLCPYTVDFKLCSRHHLTPPTESSLPLGAGVLVYGPALPSVPAISATVFSWGNVRPRMWLPVMRYLPVKTPHKCWGDS